VPLSYGGADNAFPVASAQGLGQQRRDATPNDQALIGAGWADRLRRRDPLSRKERQAPPTMALAAGLLCRAEPARVVLPNYGAHWRNDEQSPLFDGAEARTFSRIRASTASRQIKPTSPRCPRLAGKPGTAPLVDEESRSSQPVTTHRYN
jgi:hypothetical protein